MKEKEVEKNIFPYKNGEIVKPKKKQKGSQSPLTRRWLRNPSPAPVSIIPAQRTGLHLQYKLKIALSCRYGHGSRSPNYWAHNCALAGIHLDRAHYRISIDL